MRLPEYLKSNGESQSAFAKRAGVPQSTINLICNGRGTTVDTAVKIVRATGGLVPYEDLAVEDGAERAAG